MSKPSIQLDHVILLLPYKDIVTPPTWLTSNFTISPGGKHADNKTENRLVLFQDGTYLELIAFIDDLPENRKGHWWDKPFGVVDYAFTTPTEEEFGYEDLKERLRKTGTGISYDEPKEGGRIKPDGQELKWKVTFPTGIDRGMVPFWCHDVTPRERRVPVTDESATHPCGALGMAGVELRLGRDVLDEVEPALAAIVQREPSDGRFGVETPAGLEGKTSVRLQGSDEDDEQELKLTLIVRTDGKPPADVEEDVDSGVVSIKFES